MADLKGTLYEFARRIFGEERKVRFRCDYFPFVEPGVDMSIDCFACSGKGCRICKNTGWIEIMGAGMVHPEVLRRVGYDPEVYTGFAFAWGRSVSPCSSTASTTSASSTATTCASCASSSRINHEHLMD